MTPDAFLQRVRELLPALRERALLAETLRRMPEETVRDFRDGGLFRCLQPRRYGGLELDPVTFYRAIIDIGSVCGSSAWIFGVIGIHNWHLAVFPPQAQEDVWGHDNSALLSTSLAPTGTIEPVDGGYHVHGRWSFSSGCDFCQWVVLGGLVPSSEPGKPAEARTFLLPRADYQIDDNWHVVGLCGTGSKDIVVHDAFVPEHRTHSYRDAFEMRNPGIAVNDGPLYRLPFAILFAHSIAVPAIGVAQGAIDAYRELTCAKVNVRDQSRVAEDPFAQLSLAEAAADVGEARDRMLANFAEMMRLAEAGEEIPLDRRARYRWDGAKIIDLSVRAVDRVFRAAGGRAVYLSNPIQRAWRDVHAMAAHAGNNLERAAAVFGRSEFGLPPVDIRF